MVIQAFNGSHLQDKGCGKLDRTDHYSHGDTLLFSGVCERRMRAPPPPPPPLLMLLTGVSKLGEDPTLSLHQKR